MSRELEEGTVPNIDFSKIEQIGASIPGVIPAVAQDIDNGMVLMIGYVNKAALDKARELKIAVFWSTSRNELWIKGATSGNQLELVEIRVNCEQNSILYLVRPGGEGVCHTRGEDNRNRPSCFYRVLGEGELKHAPYRPSWLR